MTLNIERENMKKTQKKQISWFTYAIAIAGMIFIFIIAHLISTNAPNYIITQEVCHNETRMIGIAYTGTENITCDTVIVLNGQRKECATDQTKEKFPCNYSYCRYWGDGYSVEIIKEEYSVSFNNEEPILKTEERCEFKEVNQLEFPFECKNRMCGIVMHSEDIDEKWLNKNCEPPYSYPEGDERSKYIYYKCGDYKIEVK